ncbi:MAG: membrane protein insertion efficiency factor YidD [Candidatus Acidiferrales bacterium]
MGRGHTSEPVCRDARIHETRDGVAGVVAARQARIEIESKSSGLLRRLVLASVRGYQIFLGPFFGGSCKFQPSCSRYTYEAVRRFGARSGVLLGLKRFLRCRPFSEGGYDPVPEISPENRPNAQVSAEAAN